MFPIATSPIALLLIRPNFENAGTMASLIVALRQWGPISNRERETKKIRYYGLDIAVDAQSPFSFASGHAITFP